MKYIFLVVGHKTSLFEDMLEKLYNYVVFPKNSIVKLVVCVNENQL